MFKAMLSPRFQEGTSLRDQGTLELALPKDDAQSMETVCATIHARPELLPATLPPQQLLNFALVCDKYDFAAHVKHHAHYWVFAMMNQAKRDVLAHWVPLPAAWYLRLEDLFERASREMVLGDPQVLSYVLHAAKDDVRVGVVTAMCSKSDSLSTSRVQMAD